MAKKMIIGMVVGIIFLISFPLYGAASQAGAIFLAIYPGARPNGMGTCFTAIADDAMATYYNDAGMAFQDKTDITLMHANWLPGLYPDMYYEYVGGIHEFPGIGKIGANFTYLTTGTTEAVDEKGDPIPGGVFTSFDLAVKLSYATKLYENLSIGVGGKLIYSYLVPRWIIESIWGPGQKGGGTGTSWAIDLSMFYKTYLDGLNIGMSLQNLGPNISYVESGGSDPLPRTFRLGVAYSPIHTRINKLTLTTELTKILVGITRDINDEWKDTWKGIGIEYTLSEFLSVRGGYFWDTVGERVGPTFGGGIKFANFEFDIGVDSEIYDFPTSNYRLGLNYAIGVSPIKKTIVKGEVVNAKTREPVSADITFPGTELEPIKTDEYGKFDKSLTGEEIEILASADGYETMIKTVALKPGATIDIVFALVPEKATVTGKVTDKETGEPIQASVAIAGMEPLTTDVDGKYTTKVEPGTYKFDAESDGYVPATKDVTLEKGKITKVDFSLSPAFVIPEGGLSLEEINSLRIQFAFDKIVLTKEVKGILDKLALTLIHNPSLGLEIQGYTCEIGREEYNMEISIKRAKVAKVYLVNKWIEKNRLTIKGFGEMKPIDARHIEAARAMNRRIEFVVIK